MSVESLASEVSDVTKKKAEKALLLFKGIAECIKEVKEIPSGHLYTMLMDVMSLEVYQYAIQTLKNAKLVLEKHHLLTWIGE